MKGSKVILDTNIWVSLFITRRLSKLELLVYQNDLQLLTCHKLIDEMARIVKHDKIKRYLDEPFEVYIDAHFDLTTFVSIESRFESSPDPNDNYLFDLALQVEADYLVTGDKKLLAMESIENVQVISLRKFEEMLSGT